MEGKTGLPCATNSAWLIRWRVRRRLVTGAGRGIGRAVALQLAEGGARVVLVARSIDQLNETAEEIKDSGGHALSIPTDVSGHGGDCPNRCPNQ